MLLATGCANKPEQPAAKKKLAHAKITQFYATEGLVPKGLTGKLCYGVEGATKVALTPPVETLWPTVVRCFDISPKQKTTYTLTAWGEDGARDTKTVDVRVGAPPPRLYDLWANSIDVRKGDLVTICFKVENVKSVKVSAGHLDRAKNCLTDTPSKTTIYKITANGGDGEVDSGTVTVKVR